MLDKLWLHHLRFGFDNYMICLYIFLMKGIALLNFFLEKAPQKKKVLIVIFIINKSVKYNIKIESNDSNAKINKSKNKNNTNISK